MRRDCIKKTSDEYCKNCGGFIDKLGWCPTCMRKSNWSKPKKEKEVIKS